MLSASGDGAGHLVNFANIQRSTRKKLPFGVCQVGKAFPQRNHTGKLHLPYAGVRADGVRILLQARYRFGMVCLLEGLLQKLALEFGHQRGEPAGCATMNRRSWRSIPARLRTLSTPSRLPTGANCGVLRTARITTWAAIRRLPAKSGILRSGDQRALHSLCH